MSEHTPGAMRAAEIIVTNIATYNELRNIEIEQPPFHLVAECIDRETAAPELLKACKALSRLAVMRNCYCANLSADYIEQFGNSCGVCLMNTAL